MINKILKKFRGDGKSARAREQKATSVKPYIRSGEVFIDCGANVGKISKQALEAGAIVHAFEPNPFAFKALMDHLGSNSNFHGYQKAISNQKGKLFLYLHENSDQDEVHWSTGSSLLDYKSNVRADKSVEVEVESLTDFIDSLGSVNISVVKIDVEGAEVDILPDLIEKNYYKQIGNIFVETHDHKIPELKEKTDAIRDSIQKKKIKNIHLDWI